MVKNLSISIGGLNVNISTDNQKYFDYLNAHFHNVILHGEGKDYQIRVEILLKKDLFGNNPPNLKDTCIADLEKIGTSTLLKDHGLVKLEKVRNKKFLFEYHFEDQKLTVNVIWHHRPLKDFFQGLFKGKDDMVLANLTYYFVYYPVFWFLEKFKGLHPLHAGAVTLKGKTLVFAGLEGMGKTSLCLEIFREPDSDLISDNVVFYDNSNIYPCYQPIKVRPGQEKLIPEGKLRKIKSYKLKTFFEFENNKGLAPYKPDIFLFPRFGKKSYCNEVDKDEFLQIINNTNFLVCEMENYIHYTRLFNLISGVSYSDQPRYEALKKLVDSCRCYYLGIKRGEKISTTVERIRLLLS
jgi:hypothetical protein